MEKQLYIVRHAIAEEREEFRKTRQPDELRPLTVKGRKKFEKTSMWMAHTIDEVDWLLYSPLTRAQQTAEILAKHLNFKQSSETSTLKPMEHPKKLCQKLDREKNWTTAMVIGHEPFLSHLVCYLLGIGMKHSEQFLMKKGGVALFRFHAPLSEQKGKLHWWTTPRLTSLA
ncbi:MAG: phosphohistidine phosphatase SixA [Bdellovibrionaceae bacterium]|nr:phosphohistidine phosphatase SixA [Pseudobdellovibrionaceae bacterium]